MKSLLSFPLRQRIERCLALLLALARLLRGRSGAPGWLLARLLRSSLAILALSTAVAAVAAGADQPKKDDSAVMEMDLDALAKVEVTSVSKKAQNLNDAAAAVSVISNEEIRRSGVTSFAEALKYTPGLDYAQINAQSYAISSRGFQGQFANKLLVLMDGRSVYTPLFSGTYWDTQDYLLDDVERIEVIRGPGATVWGANAVNGVINLTTKSAKDTQGTLVTLGGGTEKNVMSGVRYGGKINDQTFFRVYGKYDVVDDSRINFGSDANDRAYKGQAGFRLDWEPDKANHVTLQGDAYGGRENATTTYPSLTAPGYLAIDNNAGNMAGGNVLGRWSHTLSEDSSLSFQAYYDRTVRNSAILHENRDTGNFDFQHNFKLGKRQDVVWGLGYRVTSDETKASPFISFMPAGQTDNLLSAFVQDEITLIDSVKLTLGSKIEHNDYTGVEVQPSARVAWKITDKQTLWGSVSRAVRTPSRVEDALIYAAAALPPGAVGPLPALVQVGGNKDTVSEELMAYEVGYRIQPHKRVNVDVATFYNDYDKLSTTAASGAPSLVAGAPSYILIPQAFGNNLRGEAYGVEAAVTFQASDWWRLYGQYTFMEMQLHARTGTTSETAEKGTPMNQFALRSSMDFTKHWNFDVGVRYVDNIATAKIGNYITADARLAWRPNDRWEVSVVGQNLVDNRHPEYANGLGGATLELERSVYGKITFRF